MTGNFLIVVLERIEKTTWTDSLRNEELAQRVKKVRNTLQTIKRMNWSHLAYELPSKTRY